MEQVRTKRLTLRPFMDVDAPVVVEILNDLISGYFVGNQASGRILRGLGFVETLEADCFTDNPASMRVLEKLGFKKIGTDYAKSAARVDASPVILYRLRRTDYESQ